MKYILTFFLLCSSVRLRYVLGERFGTAPTNATRKKGKPWMNLVRVKLPHASPGYRLTHPFVEVTHQTLRQPAEIPNDNHYWLDQRVSPSTGVREKLENFFKRQNGSKRSATTLRAEIKPTSEVLNGFWDSKTKTDNHNIHGEQETVSVLAKHNEKQNRKRRLLYDQTYSANQDVNTEISEYWSPNKLHFLSSSTLDQKTLGLAETDKLDTNCENTETLTAGESYARISTVKRLSYINTTWHPAPQPEYKHSKLDGLGQNAILMAPEEYCRFNINNAGPKRSPNQTTMTQSGLTINNTARTHLENNNRLSPRNAPSTIPFKVYQPKGSLATISPGNESSFFRTAKKLETSTPVEQHNPENLIPEQKWIPFPFPTVVDAINTTTLVEQNTVTEISTIGPEKTQRKFLNKIRPKSAATVCSKPRIVVPNREQIIVTNQINNQVWLLRMCSDKNPEQLTQLSYIDALYVFCLQWLSCSEQVVKPCSDFGTLGDGGLRSFEVFNVHNRSEKLVMPSPTSVLDGYVQNKWCYLITKVELINAGLEDFFFRLLDCESLGIQLIVRHDYAKCKVEVSYYSSSNTFFPGSEEPEIPENEFDYSISWKNHDFLSPSTLVQHSEATQFILFIVPEIIMKSPESIHAIGILRENARYRSLTAHPLRGVFLGTVSIIFMLDQIHDMPGETVTLYLNYDTQRRVKEKDLHQLITEAVIAKRDVFPPFECYPCTPTLYNQSISTAQLCGITELSLPKRSFGPQKNQTTQKPFKQRDCVCT